jgi:hypothetical protein
VIFDDFISSILLVTSKLLSNDIGERIIIVAKGSRNCLAGVIIVVL